MPNKIKSFAWRVCKNIIPIKANLCHQGVKDKAIYEACGSDEETSGHMCFEM